MFLFVIFCLCFIVYYVVRFFYNIPTGDKNLPTPPRYPIIGNALLFANKRVDEYLSTVDEVLEKYGSRFKVHFPNLIYCITDPEDIEVVLTQNDFLSKSEEYYYLQPWLGLGLLTSTGDKWRKHRKAITPSFHFKILENYIQSIHKQTDTLINILKDKASGEIFNVYPFIAHCALDIICETSMGTPINAQLDTESEYVKAVEGICSLITIRQRNVWKKIDFLYKFTDEYRRQQKYLEKLHGFTEAVIQQRKLMLNNNEEVLEKYLQNTNVYGEKRKIAFLDLLLLLKIDGKPLSDLDIRDEVDTFMFEGHDTTSSAVAFAINEISKYPEIQMKLYQEQMAISDNNDVLTYSNLQEMKYLDMVIKETLRLFPSVPFLARTAAKDTYIRDIFVPKNTSIVIYAMATHKNPKYFPEPEKFIPERFTPEESNKRNPFSIISFSAGSRNCIGQKFAMMEMKIVLSKIIKNFIIEPSGIKPILVGDLVLKPMNGVHVKLRKRSDSLLLSTD